MLWVKGVTILKTRTAAWAPSAAQTQGGSAGPALCGPSPSAQPQQDLHVTHKSFYVYTCVQLSNSAKSKADKCLCYWNPLCTMG